MDKYFYLSLFINLEAEEEIAEAETEVKARARAEAVQEIEEESNLFQRVHLALLALEADLQREAIQVHDHLLVQSQNNFIF